MFIKAPDDRAPILGESLGMHLKRVLKAYDFRSHTLSLHSLRHTFGTLLFTKKIDIKTISALLGHSTVDITYNTYIHLIKDQEQNAIAALDDL
ncbi:hypothetical protein FACS1894188_05660 [Clostridia bacterium]|nr:hypothetical protein FACS1894188_05660 [Clostridia bacterium]